MLYAIAIFIFYWFMAGMTLFVITVKSIDPKDKQSNPVFNEPGFTLLVLLVFGGVLLPALLLGQLLTKKK